MNFKIVLTILFPFTLLILFPPKKNILSEKNENKINFHVSYLKGEKSQYKDNLIHQEFKSFPKSESFGVDNGVYWIKLNIEKSKNLDNLVVYIPTHNIEKIEVYKLDNNRLQFINNTGNSYVYKKNNYHYYFPNFSVINNPNSNVIYFLKVNFLKEGNFPLKILNQKDFLSHIFTKKTYNSLYYGTCIIIILINLILFIKLKDKINLFYSLFLLSLLFKFLLYDGSLINILGEYSFYYYIEMIVHLSCEVWFILFSIKFLNLHNKHPRLTKLFFIFPVNVAFFYILYIATNNFTYVLIADIIGISLFPILWIFGFCYLKVLEYAKFYVVGYLLIIPLSLFFIIGYPSGFWKVNGDMVIVKIASWLDILVFAYAIGYRMKIKIENSYKNISDLKLYIEETDSLKIAKNNTSNAFLKLLRNNDISNTPLTLREIDILKYLIEGKNNKQISETLFISHNTVKSHVRNIYFKLNVKNRVELKEKTSILTC